MTDSPLDEVRRLKAELASAKRTIDLVGQGMARLEQQLSRPDAAAQPGVTPVAPPPPIGAPPPTGRPVVAGGLPMLPPVAAHPSPGPRPVAPVHPAFRQPPLGPGAGPGPLAPARPPSALAAWWQRESTVVRVLGVAGAIVTLVGLTLLLVLAVQQNWFTPPLRVGLGTVLSVALLATAWVVHGRDQRAGRATSSAVALAATGHVGLYLVVLAVTRLYRWVEMPLGVLLAGVVGALGVFTAVRWQSQLMAILQVVSIGLLAQPLTDSWAWAGVFVVLVTITLAPVHVHSWRKLGVASFLVSGLVQLVAAVGAGDSALAMVTVVSALLLLTGTGVAVAEARRGPSSGAGAFAVITGSVPWLVVSFAHPAWRSVGLLAAAVVLGLIVFGVTPRERTSGDRFGWAVVVGPTLAAMLLVAALPMRVEYLPAAMLAAAVVFCLLAGGLRAEPVAGGAAVVSVAGLLALVPMVAITFDRYLVAQEPWPALLLAGLAAAAWAAAALWALSRLPRVRAAMRPGLVVAVLVGLLGLMMASVAVGVAVGRSIADEDVGFTSGHAIGTIVWMLAAAVLLVRGLRRAEHADLGVKLALGLSGVAVAKLFLYDLAALDGIWRGAAFVVVGLLLLGLGIGYAKALERARGRAGAGNGGTAAP